MDFNNYYQQAEQAIQQGAYQEAIELYQKCLSIKPQETNVYGKLGLSFLLVGKEEEADEIWFNGLMQESIEEDIFSEELEQTLSLAIIDFLNSEQIEKAKIVYLKLLELNEQGMDEKLLSDNGNLQYQYIVLHKSINNYKIALEFLKKVIDSGNFTSQIYQLQGDILDDLGRFSEAEEAYRISLNLNAKCSEGWNKLIRVLEKQNKLHEAIEGYKNLINLMDNPYEIYNFLGDLYMITGNMGASRKAYLNAWNLKPEECCGAVYSFSKLHKYKSLEDETFISLLQMENNSQSLSDLNKCFLYYALSKAYDDLEQNDQAFLYLTKANQIQKLYSYFNEESQKKSYKTFVNIFSKDFFERISYLPNCPQTPIFIIGMPRSGSTLIEQILSNHPDIYGAGEKHPILDFSSTQLLDQYPQEIIKQMQNQSNLIRYRENYLQQIYKIVPSNYQHFTDKTLANFFWVGLIQVIFPNSYIIHCTRNPIDTCLSCFQHAFQELPWACDLAEIGREYNRYSFLMEHWNNVLPGRMLEVKYEDIIVNFEENVRKIINYCNLSWSDNCLKYYENTRSVETTSNYQVRQPIYKTSINKWKRYEKYLKPLLDNIEPKYLEGWDL